MFCFFRQAMRYSMYYLNNFLEGWTQIGYTVYKDNYVNFYRVNDYDQLEIRSL